LVDIRRLAIEVAREGSPAVAAAGAAAPTQQAAEPRSEPRGTVQVTTVEPQTAAPAAPVRRAEAAPRPTQAAPTPAPQAPAQRADPAPARAPDREAYAQARRQESGPTAAEVAAARPREGRGPSFNCRYARSTSERLVCDDGELAALDRRLNAAFEDAIAAGAPRRELRLEQDRWLAQREAAAPDRNAVRDAYRRRIRELDALQ
jgi:uncharacterized protein YecT (DUF1311 family)